MNFDFQAIMLLALVITGLVWLVDIFMWAPKRKDNSKEPLAVEYSRSFFPIILIVLILRSFIVEPFRIPSASMMPTLLAGDFILVNKFSYGIRLPLLGTKVVEMSEPLRGDVVVFRFPKDPSIDYIKRVVGLPGDRISYINKTIYVNGKPMEQESLGTYLGKGAGMPMSGASQRIEHLDDVDHQILVRSRQRAMDREFIVPDERYFVMGDNRDNSNDSRFWGTVPEANLVGKAFMIWMNWDAELNEITWQRIGSSVK